MKYFVDMKRYSILIVFLFCAVFFGFVSCYYENDPTQGEIETEPRIDLSKKEMDPRLIGTWIRGKPTKFTVPITFQADGSVVGFPDSDSGKNTVFCTTKDSRLFIFLNGYRLYLSNTREYYYEIHGDTLKRWISREAMEKGRSPSILVRVK